MGGYVIEGVALKLQRNHIVIESMNLDSKLS